jgi:type III pantothenate kinase
MLLAVDAGNTNVVVGVFEGERLAASWRLTTSRSQTVDEFGLLLRGLFNAAAMPIKSVKGAIVASVVPPLDSVLRQSIEQHFSTVPIMVGPGLKTGIPILYEPPSDVGADRIVNAVAAVARYGAPTIVVDFGTATTFDVISKRGEYAGGIIAPGVGIAAEALFARAARLPRVELRKPDRLIGNTTVGSIQSGLYFGYLGLVDGILERLFEDFGGPVTVIATGGWSTLLAGGSRHIRHVEPMMTLEGLRLLWERNAGSASGAR